MSLQESSAETKSLPSTKKLLQLLKLPALVINQCFISKAPFFTMGMVVGYTFMVNLVSSQMMDYFTNSLKSQRIAAIIINLQDGLSCLFVVIGYLISEAYSGRLAMITFCSSVSIMGLMQFWISATTTSIFEYDMVFVAMFLITLGGTGESMSSELFNYQLCEEVTAKRERKPEHEGTDNARKEDLNTDNHKRQGHIIICTSSLWWFCVRFLGYTALVSCYILADDWRQGIRFGALLMVGSYLLFCFGYAWHSRENLPAESNLGKIYRICKVAYRKRRLKYPTSENGYYWKNYKQSHLHEANHARDLRLFPRFPSLFRWLDKAAIVKEQSANYDLSSQRQEMKGELCTVKEVREVKSIALLFCWGFTFLGYSLVAASANTFFVAQASNLTYFTRNDISLLFVLRNSICDILTVFFWLTGIAFKRTEKVKMIKNWVINLGFKRIDATIMRISVGMVCAVICCILAWHVEVHRLYLIKKEGILQNPDGNISMSSKALVPQFLLLGITEKLVEEGLNELFRGYASKSMRTFDESFSQLVIGIGKLLAIPCILVSSSWLKESVNTSHLDRYYLMLAVLNFVFLLVFALYYFMYAYKNEFPEDEVTTMEEGPEHQPDSQEANATNENLSTREEPMVSQGDEENAMGAGLVPPRQAGSKEADTRKEISAIRGTDSEEDEDIVMEQD